MSRRFSIGLTGGIGSGKTTIANMFAGYGAAIVDTDLIAHELTCPQGLAMPAILSRFGPQFVNPDGSMNRQRMREHVFSNPDARHQLEQILHPLIRQQTEQAAQTTPGLYLIFVVPLLTESGNWWQKADRILVIDCEEQTQIQRVMQRNHLSQQQVMDIMHAQATRQQRAEIADDIIFNDGDLHLIRQHVFELHRKYLQLAGIPPDQN